MKISLCEESGDRLLQALDVLLAEEPHLEYANFAPVAARSGAAQRLHRSRWLSTDERIANLVARDAGDRPLAALALSRRPFESEHFDRPMAQIALPVAVAEDGWREAALEALYPAALARLSADGYRHVAARASTRDRVSGWMAQRAGGIHVDTQVSWMAALSGMPHDESAVGNLELRAFDRDSVKSVERDRWKRLAEWGGAAFDRGPLVFDLTLPYDRSRRIYEVWTSRVMTGDWADAVIVAFDHGEAVAFISMLELSDVSEAAGAKVCGRGLGATLPEYRGLFTIIQREMITTQPLGAAFMENETQVATIGSINVYAKMGFRYLRSTCTYNFHPDG